MNEFRRIVVPIDYSEPSDAALRVAAKLARAFDGRMLVFHFIPIEVYALADYPIVADPSIRIGTESERLRAHVRKVLGEHAPPVEIEVSWGSPYMQIADYAIEHEADLIVMGTHGRTGVKHLLLGSVAERTVRLARCPVLTVRGGAAVALPAGAGVSRDRPRAQVAAMMGRAPVTVASTDTLQRAHALMVEAGVRHLPVVDGTHLVGMLSDRDLGPHVGHFEHTRVNVAMTAEAATATPDTSVEDAARLMLTRKVRALPIVEHDRLVGILSSTDILEDYVRVARE